MRALSLRAQALRVSVVRRVGTNNFDMMLLLPLGKVLGFKLVSSIGQLVVSILKTLQPSHDVIVEHVMPFKGL